MTQVAAGTGGSIAEVLVMLGAVLLAGLAADLLARRTPLPRVTLLLLIGAAAGPLGLDMIPESGAALFPFIADLALLMVAFLLGGELRLSMLRQHGRAVIGISLTVVVVTGLTMTLGLMAFGWPWEIGLLMGAIATSTAPAAVSDVVREARSRGPFTKTLLGVVAVDDAWGLAALSFALAAVLAIGQSDAAHSVAISGLVDLLGAILLGCLLGIPMALLSGRVRAGEPTQAEALGGVLLCGGLALMLGVSMLLAAMTMGVVVANLAHHHRRSFRAIEGIDWPFKVLFFVMSGAMIHAADITGTVELTGTYIVLRTLGKFIGGWLGSRASGEPQWATMIGVALLPQAGIAIGMALVVSQHVPELNGAILTATVASTVLFELVGPIMTRHALLRFSEARADDS